MSRALPSQGPAALALVFNAFTWGLSWWPFRQMEARGLHPLWLTVFIFGAAVLMLLLARPRVFDELRRRPALWVLVLAAGTTNASFNWGVTIGDVVRVVLLFYLMPLWTVLLARPLLGERLNRAAASRMALALGGAFVVLWPAEGVDFRLGLADALGLAGGASFALNNVMLRREAGRSSETARALAMFAGGWAVALGLAVALMLAGRVPAPPAPATGWLLGSALLALWFLGSNLALQYGASRLPAHTTAVIMITEVFFASASALALGSARLDARTALGGALILAAAALAAWQREPASAVS